MKASLCIGTLAVLMPLSLQAMTVTVTPTLVFQGDPIMITVSGTSTQGIQSGKIVNSTLHFFRELYT